MKYLLSILLLGILTLSLSACVTQSDRRADLKAVLQQQIKACYILPEDARSTDPVVIEARLNPDGSLERSPEVIHGPSNSTNAKAAVLALKKCAPFKIPEHWATRYRDWKVMHIQFDPI